MFLKTSCFWRFNRIGVIPMWYILWTNTIFVIIFILCDFVWLKGWSWLEKGRSFIWFEIKKKNTIIYNCHHWIFCFVIYMVLGSLYACTPKGIQTYKLGLIYIGLVPLGSLVVAWMPWLLDNVGLIPTVSSQSFKIEICCF